MVKQLGQICAIVGGQWGDEGKGKLVDILAESYDIVVRATGGANAGHTIYVGNEDRKFVFHLIPAGMLHPGKICVMGNGMVIHLPTLIEEMEVLKNAGIKLQNRLFLSDRAHLVFGYHKLIDRIQEERKKDSKVGTTGRGIGPAYTDKVSRMGIRTGELRNFIELASRYRQNLAALKKMYGFSYNGESELREIKNLLPQILPRLKDTSAFLHNALTKKKKILLEGANGTLLDIDHGTYPYVTSSNASVGGLITGSGIPPSALSSVIGIMKAYVTRVGSGPFPTELRDSRGEKIRTIGREFGATTGRPRRCGWFDVVAARYALFINGLTALNLTKLDVLNMLPEIEVGVAYCYKGKHLLEFPSDLSILEKCTVEYITLPGWQRDISNACTFKDLPKNCQRYVKTLEKLVGCPIFYIGTGPRRDQMIFT